MKQFNANLTRPAWPLAVTLFFAATWSGFPTQLSAARDATSTTENNTSDEGKTGRQIYLQQCASCHGPNGQGVKKKYGEPLTGKRSLASLTKYIDRQMPEEDEDKCTGEDAAKVASYIYDAFYSLAAQSRNYKPRVELSRLTVTQYRNTIADLIASFSNPIRLGDKPYDKNGLEAIYINDGRSFNLDRKVLSRIEPLVDHNFGSRVPVEKLQIKKYGVAWVGSIYAPRTGKYEFILKTPNGTRLWLNDNQTPLIDGLVRSGNRRQVRESIYLIGGRAYPIRVDMLKLVKDKTASITLMWKQPHRAEQIVPHNALWPVKVPEVMLVKTPSPPDDASMGYVRSTGVTRQWDEATTYAAIEVTEFVTKRLFQLTGKNATDTIAYKNLKRFCYQFTERAFRMPLSYKQRQFFVDRHFASGKDLELAVKKTILLTLKSPRFLYQELGGKPANSFAIASRLSYGLWDSMPDKALLEATGKGQLKTPGGVRKQIIRMLNDPRTKIKINAFFEHWLKLEHVHERIDSATRSLDFDENVIADLRASLDLLIDDVVWNGNSDYRKLLLADHIYMNDRLKTFYAKQPGVEKNSQVEKKKPKENRESGKDQKPKQENATNEILDKTKPTKAKSEKVKPGDKKVEKSDRRDLFDNSPFEKVTMKGQPQAGILTHPLLMAGFAYESSSSPIHRGVFVVRSLLGRRLRPPPIAVTPVDADLHPNLTTRQRVAQQTSSNACMTCHGMINQLGFTLENFDAVGRFRDTEKGKPLDARGSYQGLDGKAVKLNGARELGEFLVKSPEAHDAFIERLFQHITHQPMLAYGLDTPKNLRAAFIKNEYSIRKILAEMVMVSAMINKE